jgi:hypothetical protein
MTNGYLIYGDISNIKKYAYEIFADFNLIDSVKRHLDINEKDYEIIPDRDKKTYLYEKLRTNETFPESTKNQIKFMIDRILIFNVDDIGTLTGGRTRRRKYTRRRYTKKR